ncbi:MAG: hypothetical protein WCP16_21390 [Pseudanabaena sp. ELA645]|jgi:hypothetical protein
MTSLMQEFAEARQQRLQERAEFLVDCEQAKQEWAREFQEQSEATADYLAHAEQTRLAGELGRQAIAEIALDARLEEVKDRASQVSEYLQELSTNRTEQAAEASEQRAQDVRTRTFKMRSQLKHIHKARVRAAQADQVQRRQLVEDRAALTQMQIEDLTKNRLASATLASQQRYQEFSDRAANVKNSLENLETTRLEKANAQALKLKAFRTNLTNSVWAGARSVAAPQVKVSVQASVKVSEVSVSNSSEPKKKNGKAESVAVKSPEPAIAKPVEVKDVAKETPKEVSKVTGKIEQFVVDYVSQLSTNSSLLEVVNDRDTVRDLLAQGANTLKVDPSDILNTLLQMAEGS